MNTSKHQAALSAATVELGSGASCTVKLPEPTAVGPGERKVVKLAHKDVVLACLKPPRASKDNPLRLSVITEAERAARPALRVMKPDKLRYEVQLGKHNVSETLYW